MERLTTWNGKKYVLPQGRTCDGESYWRIIADRLAAYENTGFEPWELPQKPRPKGYYVEIWSGECYHKELWYGLPEELDAHMSELRGKAERDWGWHEPVIAATEWERRR